MYDYAMTPQPLLRCSRCDFAAAIVLLLQTYHRHDFAADVILRRCDYTFDRLTVAVTMK